MVSFTPTEDQQLLTDTLNRFALKDVRPVMHEADETSTAPDDVVNVGWQIGLVPTAIPEAYGGFGEMSALTNVIAAEELAFGDLSVAMHIFAPALFAIPVTLYGTDQQKSEYLPLFLDETIAPATAAFLEPEFFFDPNNLTTTATQNGDNVIIEGVKAYVPLAETSELILVYAKNANIGTTDAYIVPKSSNGIRIEKCEQLMGIRALPSYRVHFDAVEIPSHNRLGGDAGADVTVLMNRSRLALATMAVGVARASFEYARDYAKQRVQFGKPIAQNQAIAFMLAEMAIEIDATRLLVWEAAWKLDRGEDITREAVLAQAYANKMVLEVTDGGVQTLGGYGFIREYPVERWLRNGRGFPTFHGLAMI